MSGLERNCFTVRIALVGKESEWRATALQGFLNFAIPQQISGHVSGAGENQRMTPAVEARQDERHVAAISQVLYQHAVYLLQDVIHFESEDGERAHISAGQCHNQR